MTRQRMLPADLLRLAQSPLKSLSVKFCSLCSKSLQLDRKNSQLPTTIYYRAPYAFVEIVVFRLAMRFQEHCLVSFDRSSFLIQYL